MQNLSNLNPLVSIIIPVYNGANYVKEAIESAINQTYNNIEIIVINDGSNDNFATRQICLSYESRIRYIEKENGGVSSALNCGIKAMRGEFFSWLSHDDVYYPEKVEVQIAELNKLRVTDVIIFSNYTYIDFRSKLIKRTVVKESGNGNPIYSVIMGNLNGCSLLIPAVCFQKTGLFDEELKTIQDYALFAKLAEHYRFIHIPNFLVSSRIHGMQQGTQSKALHLDAADNFFYGLLKKYECIELTSIPACESIVYLWFSYRLSRINYTRSALKAKEIARIKKSNESIIYQIIWHFHDFYYSKVKLNMWRFLYYVFMRIKRL